MSPYAKDVVCYYHEPLKAPLLRAAVLPAMRRATAVGAEVHLDRHWLHGPHVRIHVVGTPSTVRAVADELSAYVRLQPSKARLSPAALLDQAVAAGRAELVPPPYEPIWPDNTVRIEEPGAGALAGLLDARTTRVRADVLRLGVPAISDTLGYLERHDDASSSRVRTAMAALVVHAARSPAGLFRGYLSFRSHLEDYLHRGDPEGVARARQADAWSRNADAVVALVDAFARGDGHARPEPADAWHRWATLAWQSVEIALDRGDLSFPSTQEYERRARVLDDPALRDRAAPAGQGRGISEFHRMYRAARHETSDQTDRQFTIYRFCTNMLYRLLAACDVTAGERYLAASLVCDAVERLSGRTWREHLSSAQPPVGHEPTDDRRAARR